MSSIGGGLTTGQHDTTITTAGGAGNLFVESLEVAQDVAANQDHIGYTSLANLDVPNLGVVKMSGIYPSTGTVLNGTYPMPRELFLAVRGTAARSRLDFTDQVYGDDWVNYFRSAPRYRRHHSAGLPPARASGNQPIPDADVNMDGATGLPDVGQIIQKWGISSACSGWIRADVNNNAAVGLTDVGGLIQRWGQPGFTCAVGTNCPTS